MIEPRLEISIDSHSFSEVFFRILSSESLMRLRYKKKGYTASARPHLKELMRKNKEI